MIFLTVGTQLPFDRLVKSVDNYCHNNEINIIAQIGNSKYKPSKLAYKDFYLPDEIDEYFDKASVIVSHAGMGTIISCIRKGKPLVIFPRLSKYGEHRNDHQVDTVNSFLNFTGIYIAYTEQELFDILNKKDSLNRPEKNIDMQCKGILNFINTFYFLK